MTTAEQSQSFFDTGLARLLALLIAIGLAFLLWSNWSSDFKALLADKDDTPPPVSASEPAKPANAALEACLANRVGDVDKMKEDGLISDAQYGKFKGRAEDLCRAQNTGG